MNKLLQYYSIGKNIQKIRASHHMTQADLAAALEEYGRDNNTLSQIENGKRNIFIGDLVRLKLIFNVPYDEFFIGLDSQTDIG